MWHSKGTYINAAMHTKPNEMIKIATENAMVIVMICCRMLLPKAALCSVSVPSFIWTHFGARAISVTMLIT